MSAYEMMPGIGDYREPEEEESYEDYYEGWYLFNEDRSDGWDDIEGGGEW